MLWATAWNAHDLDALLRHFAEDVTFTSPVAARIMEDSRGVVSGREQLRKYWARGLELTPDLHFEVLDTYSGIDLLVINFRNERGRRACEVLKFNGDGLVTEGHGSYLDAGA
jgi:ketosteroid isomerase-like protein